jgi:hypothetical protein
MFNWETVPIFAVMLLFWLLACYLLMRSPRGLLPLTAAAALVATAVHLLGQGMQANAPTLDQWRPWARNLLWGATLAPALWCWVTLLLLREQDAPALRGYLRLLGYPLGVAVAILSAALSGVIYAGDSLFIWSAPSRVPASQVIYSHYHLSEGIAILARVRQTA